jgi:hypothetical protein
MRFNKLNELTASEHRAIAAALLIIGLLALHNWLISPQVASLRASQRYEQATSAAISKSKTVRQALDAKRRELEQLLARRTLLAEMVFQNAEAEQFFSELEPLCTEAHCIVLSFNHMDTQTSGRRDREDRSVERRMAMLSIQGGYNSIVSLMERLATCKRKVWIDKIDIMSGGGDSAGVTCNLAISIYVHREKEDTGHD